MVTASTVVGTPLADAGSTNSLGEAYVIFTNEIVWDPSGVFVVGDAADNSNLTGSNGITLRGTSSNDALGMSVGGVGDVNGDGLGDAFVGLANATGSAGLVVFGKTTPYNDIMEVSDFTSSGGFEIVYHDTLSGGVAKQFSGTDRSIDSAGDINGDGYDDIVIGFMHVDNDNAPPGGNTQNQLGEAFVIFGSDSLSGSINVDTLSGAAGTGFRIYDAAASLGDHWGSTVSSAGDVNGDGIEDVMVAGDQAKQVAVIFGTDNIITAIDINTLRSNPGVDGFVIETPQSGDDITQINEAGDINGDGYTDLLIGTDDNDAYVIFGAASFTGLGGMLDVTTLNGTNGFTIDVPVVSSSFGNSVSGIGDFNGDGYDDLIIDDGLEGNSFLIYGQPSFTANFNVTALNGGPEGFQLSGFSASLYSQVSGAGDVDGDGFDDLLLSDPESSGAGNNNNEGSVYIIYGFDNEPTNNDYYGDATNNSLTGTGADENFYGKTGDDYIDGGGGADLNSGGQGDDTFVYDAADTYIDGGFGNDTLVLDMGDSISFTNLDKHYIKSIENIDMKNDTGANTLTIDAVDLVQSSEDLNEMFVTGDAGDTVTSNDTWADTGTQISTGGVTYDIYTLGGSTLYVDQDITNVNLM